MQTLQWFEGQQEQRPLCFVFKTAMSQHDNNNMAIWQWGNMTIFQISLWRSLWPSLKLSLKQTWKENAELKQTFSFIVIFWYSSLGPAGQNIWWENRWNRSLKPTTNGPFANYGFLGLEIWSSGFRGSSMLCCCKLGDFVIQVIPVAIVLAQYPPQTHKKKVRSMGRGGA